MEKAVVKHQNKQKTIEINRNILAKRLAYTAKTGRTIDLRKALTFQLSLLPLCFAHPNGTRRTTQKSQLMETILSYCVEVPTFVALSKQNISAHMVDLMALIRTLQAVRETYEELSIRLFEMLPSGYSSIDIVAEEVSLKDLEREKRGVSEKVLIRSANPKFQETLAIF